MDLFRELLKEKNLKTGTVCEKRNKLEVTYTRSRMRDKLVAPKGSIWYHADIKHYDETGHLNTGYTVFQVSLIAEKQKGEEAVKSELNQIVATKMKALIELHKNS